MKCPQVVEGSSRILLLQGPVGPFFKELQGRLRSHGWDAQHVTFNAGDRFFANRKEVVRFSGTLDEWETWLRFELTQKPPEAIILFGSNRPAHQIARRIAKLFDVDVISLEEGYLRSGYLSCEWGGNNHHSPLTHWEVTCPPICYTPGVAPAVEAQRSSFPKMSCWGAVYYLVRDLASKVSDEHLFHKPRERVLSLAWSWGVHMLRRVIARATEFPIRRFLNRKRNYILVPLQVSSDSQLQLAARGWSTTRLIDASLKALLVSGKNQHIVFKLHPLERQSAAIKRLILQKAKQFRLDRRRISILHSGRMGDLTQKASGMLVINSTSAFSALHHDIPIMVLGEAVFRHDDVVTLGETEADIEAFFSLRHARSQIFVNAFMSELKVQSLIPGDFYASKGRKVAFAGIIGKLQQRQHLRCSPQKVSG